MNVPYSSTRLCGGGAESLAVYLSCKPNIGKHFGWRAYETTVQITLAQDRCQLREAWSRRHGR